jgi:hypothetical protein
MNYLFEGKIKTSNGKFLISNYETTRDAHCIYRELIKHATSSIPKQFSGDLLLNKSLVRGIPVSGAEHQTPLIYIGQKSRHTLIMPGWCYFWS